MSQPPNRDTDLSAGEMGIALIAAATWFFLGPWGILPTIWLAYAITSAYVPPESRRRLLTGPVRAIRAARALPDRVRALTDAVRSIPDRVRAAIDDDAPLALPAPESTDAPSARSAAAAQPATQSQADTRRGVATAERPRWLSILNDEPDQRPHAIILGPTRSGKTTMATAAMADRGGRSIVLTPKVNPSNWSGAEIVTLDDTGGYADIGQALLDIEQEKRDRIGKLRRGEPMEPLTIVYDEIGEMAAFIPEAPEQMTQLSSIGAELNMRIIGIGTSDEALGVKRWKATRNNYIRVETNTDRGAMIHDGVRSISVKPRESLALAQAAQLVPWRGAAPAPAAMGTTANLARHAPAEADDLLASLLATMSPERAARLQSITVARPAGGDVHVNVVQAQAAPAHNATRQAKDSAYDRALVALYQAAGADGIPFARAYATHKGTKEIAFTAWQDGRKSRSADEGHSPAS